MKLSELETMESKDDKPVHIITPLPAKIDKNIIEILVNGQQFAAVALDTLVEVKTVSRGLLAEITYRLEAMTRSAEPEPQEQREPTAWRWGENEMTPNVFTEVREIAEQAALSGHKVTPLYL